MISIVVPVYRNEGSLPALLERLEQLRATLGEALELVFVVDGSPDASFALLRTRLPSQRFTSQLLALSRNFGAFSAIRAGLAAARGRIVGVMAADLQEPPELMLDFVRALDEGDADVALGKRVGRADPWTSRTLSRVYWGLYRRFVQPDIPPGGVDVFACRAPVRDALVALEEGNTSVVGLLCWLGFRRVEVPYVRQARTVGKSAWSFRKRLRYLSDSVFSFSDLPIRLILYIGILGLMASSVLAIGVVIAKLSGAIPVPGYAATVLTVTFFGALNCFGLGLLGGYMWRTLENTKRRPNFVTALHEFHGTPIPDGGGDGQSVLPTPPSPR